MICFGAISLAAIRPATALSSSILASLRFSDRTILSRSYRPRASSLLIRPRRARSAIFSTRLISPTTSRTCAFS